MKEMKEYDCFVSKPHIRTLGEKQTTNISKKQRWKKTRKLLETKYCSGDLIKGRSNWIISLVRCSGPFLKWTIKELRDTEITTRKLKKIHNLLHSRDNIDRFYGSRKGKRGRKFASFEDCVDAVILGIKE